MTHRRGRASRPLNFSLPAKRGEIYRRALAGRESALLRRRSLRKGILETGIAGTKECGLRPVNIAAAVVGTVGTVAPVPTAMAIFTGPAISPLRHAITLASFAETLRVRLLSITPHRQAATDARDRHFIEIVSNKVGFS